MTNMFYLKQVCMAFFHAFQFVLLLAFIRTCEDYQIFQRPTEESFLHIMTAATLAAMFYRLGLMLKTFQDEHFKGLNDGTDHPV
jgi:uncharacterized membrane protein